MYLYLEPLVTLIGAHFLLNEEIQWTTLVGGGIILLGVCLATRRFRAQAPQTLAAADKPFPQGEEGSLG